ncbi:DNA polymerase Y family protein [Hongsoonwoonella zoysiae]|uniref:DNA polymerase Y family protein n=1 Tax=Hongsoonwoonella zoysiae TaxID=2821844 RepID=UPI001FE3BB15|nr:DNA polymerase Y family protein [Hongsoonwoonella zoysiae]
MERRQAGRSWRSPDRFHDRNSVDAEARPRAISGRIRNAERIYALNAAAVKLGLRKGEALADARARIPSLFVEEADEAADAALLAALADWCDRYTPLVALDGADGLLLDITGCAHLFAKDGEDGEAALAADCTSRLGTQGFSVRIGIADTVGAAWAVARFPVNGAGAPVTIVPPGGAREAIAPLPLAALRLEEDAGARLERVGLKRVEDVLGRPRAPLAARFGTGLIRRLDQALGGEDEPISPRLAAPALAAERRFFEPVSRTEDVKGVLLSLARQLAGALERRGEGGRAFELALFRVDGVVSRVMVGTSRPLRTPERVLSLFSEKLGNLGDELDAGFGFDLIRLGVIEAQREDPSQADMAGGDALEDDLADLVDRLGARLGLARVARFLPCDRHLPEARQALVPAATVRDDVLVWSGEAPDGEDMPLVRPLRLIDPPEPVEAIAMVPEGPPLRFRWRKALYEVAASEGPERIAPPWWPGGHGGDSLFTRDYFRVEDEAGRHFWLYREGLYERETEAPRWYLQGLFG